MQSEAPCIADLSSLKHDDIIDCLLKFIEEKNWHQNNNGPELNFDQKKWLSDVTNHGLDEYGDVDPNPVVDWKNPQQIAFALLNLSQAGQKLNALKYMEEGIYDYIGTNLPEFKSHPDYKVFPSGKTFTYKNKTYTMTSTIFSSLNDEFNTNTEVPVKTENEMNPNRMFNKKFLDELNKMQEICGAKERLILALNRRQRRKYGRLIKNGRINGIDLRQIHAPGASLYNQKTGVLDYPNGLQIRANTSTDGDTVLKFGNIIAHKQWDKTKDQIILILLPEEYQYVDEETGIRVIYGILDGNHRFKAAETKLEEFVCAWIVEMDLGEIYEFGNAYCNRDDNVVKPRTNEDMANSLVLTANNPNSDLYEDLNTIDKEDKEYDSKVKDVLEKKLQNDYQLDMRTIPAVIRIFFDSEGHHYTPDMKPYTSPSINSWIVGSKKEWEPYCKDVGAYIFKKDNAIFIVFQHKGDNIDTAIMKAARVHKDYPNLTIHMVVVPNNDAGLQAKDLHEWGQKVKAIFYNRMAIIGGYHNYLQQDDAVVPAFSRIPVSRSLGDFDNGGKNLIRII
tara:strand:- start:98 stop:1783 length:1686 start_codon:yes stop_codon:yes gene_type:complete